MVFLCDHPEGIGVNPVVARGGMEAFELVRKLCPGCRLEGVIQVEEGSAEVPGLCSA